MLVTYVSYVNIMLILEYFMNKHIFTVVMNYYNFI